MPGLPATTRTARDHLWAVGGRGRHHARDVVGLDEVGAGAAGVEADVDDLDVAGEVAPGAEQQARLERGERDGAVGRRARPAPPRR